MTPLILTGDSHLGALRFGAELDPPLDAARLEFWPLGQGRAVPGRFFSVDPVTGAVSTDVPRWRNRTYAPETVQVDGIPALLGVSIALNSARLLRDFSWDIHVPWRLQNSQHEFPLSDRVIDALIDQDSGNAVAFLVALKAAGLPVFAIEGPRFFANADYLGRFRFDVCCDIEARFRTRIVAAIDAAGIDIVRQPEDTVTAEGTTDLRFDHDDPNDTHHANAAFGRRMLERILEYADSAG